MKILFALAPVVFVAACATPIPPSKTADDLSNAQAEYDRINEIVAPGTPPAGTANYAGFVGAELIIDGETGGSFLGDLALTVDFTDPVTGITGSIEDITIFDEGVPDQDLGGSLNVAGGYNGSFSATASGDLSAVSEDGGFSLKGSTNVSLNMTGDLVDDNGTNTFVGDVTGGSTGGDFDVTVVGLGDFYAVQGN